MVESTGHSPILRVLSWVKGALFLSFISFFPTAPFAQASTVLMEPIPSQDSYEVGKSYPVLFVLNISKGWYLHGTEEDEKGLIPTRLSFREPEGIKVKDVLFPLPEFIKFEYTAHPIQTFSGRIPVHASLIISDDTPPGEHTVRGILSYQACSVSACLPPDEVRFTLAVTVVTKGTPTHSLNRDLFLRGDMRHLPWPAGLWLSLIGFFLGGLALNLTPCIYPLIPITVSYFGGRTRSGSTLLQAGLYLLGLAVTNSALGLWAALSGRLLGSVLQSPLVVILMAALFFMLAMSFFGFWEFRLPSWLTRRASKNYGGYFGAFFMGLTLGIVAAPCLGPFILGLLTYVAQLGNPWAGFLCFFVLSLGLGLPLAVLAFFSGAVDRLPLSGDWMVWIRKLMGWILVAMAVYVVRTLIPSELGKAALTALVPIGASLHLCWFDRTGFGVRRFLLFKRALGFVLVAAAFIYFGVANHTGPAVPWVPYEEPRMARALQDQKPLILDVYADWCVPCRAMDKKLFTDPDVVKLSSKAVMMRLDLTRRNTSQEELLKKYGIKGVPTILFFNSKGVEVRELRAQAYLDKEEFLARLKKVLPDEGQHQ
jgi:thiol:disulfide interchange protein DsbD